MPSSAKENVQVAKNLVRAQFLRCINATSLPTLRAGDVYNTNSKRSANVVQSPILGEYNVCMTEEADAKIVVDELMDVLKTSDVKVGESVYPQVDVVLNQYCERPDVDVFPFDQSEMGLNTEYCRSLFEDM